eukprot:4140617-Amphidinium_carterae.1
MVGQTTKRQESGQIFTPSVRFATFRQLGGRERCLRTAFYQRRTHPALIHSFCCEIIEVCGMLVACAIELS